MKNTWRNILKARLLALCITIGWATAAECFDTAKYPLQIIAADEQASTRRIVSEFEKRFPTAHIAFDVGALEVGNKHAIYIAVGPAALRALLKQGPHGDVVSVFTTSQTYREILSEVSEARRSSVTAIYADPSPYDQLRLISAIYKRRTTVAVLLSDKSAYLIPELKRTAGQTNTELLIELLANAHDLNRALNHIAAAKVLLAVPDSTIYSPENIRNILITTYRRDQLVIGFSTAFVKAGATATTYSTIDDVAAQTELLLNEYAASGRLPQPQFPMYFNVTVNDSVARSLNLVIDDSVRKLSRSGDEQKP